MSIFEYISVTISIVLGLAIARLLTGFGELIMHRRQVEFHWVPLTWATTLFFLILVYWWQLFSVGERLEEWSVMEFFMATIITVPLYLASMLFLPKFRSDESVNMFDAFVENGKWGVGAYLVFFLMALPINQFLFETPVFSAISIPILVAIATTIGTIVSRSPIGIGLWTCGFVIMQLVGIFNVLFIAY